MYLAVRLWFLTDRCDTNAVLLVSTIAFTNLFMSCAMLVEGVIGYELLGNYPVMFHRACETRVPHLRLIAQFFSTVVFSGTAATIVASEFWRSFGDSIPMIATHPFEGVGTAIYYVLTTLVTVGYGDIVPTDYRGKVIACIVEFFSVTFLALFVTRTSGK